MASDWIIIGAVLVLVAGVVLAFRTAAGDPPKRKSRPPKAPAKRMFHNG